MTLQRLSRLGLFCAVVYLVAVSWLFLAIRRAEGGRFVYALDDPYIHLALAENLAHGHYGINAGESSSPSSSVVWPFLLVPFAGTRVHVFVPLAWNLCFGTLAAYLIGWAVEGMPALKDFGPPLRVATAVLLLFTANLFSLTFVGMEHVLQVLLSVCCAFGLVEALAGRAIPRWCLAAAMVAPAVRYEDLLLTAAVCLALAGQRAWKRAMLVGGASLVPPAAFSAFLRFAGMPMLPMSVLVKGGAYATGGALHRLTIQMSEHLTKAVTEPDRMAVLVYFGVFCWLALRAKERVRRFCFAGAALLAGMQLMVGRFNWFHRYEVYAVIFLSLVLLRVVVERPRFPYVLFVVGLLCGAVPYIAATMQTKAASLDIYRQQYQMHRFVTEFYTGKSYAVNDVGLASFERRPGAYVLDVFGLASAEALRMREKPAWWMEETVARHGAGLAMLYPEWFHIPAAWTPVARLCEPEAVVSFDGCMVFYSTESAGTAAIRRELEAFGATLPEADDLEMDPERGPDVVVPVP